MRAHVKILISLIAAAALLAAMSMAQDAATKAQYFTSDELTASLSAPVNGIAFKEFLNRPGSAVSIIRRANNGVVEVHLTQNDIIVVQSGQGSMSVGGQVTNNHEEQPGEWRGGEVQGGTMHALRSGDVIFIPAGVAHQALVSPPASLTYIIVKTPK
jgi:mannose-6-phosphate isomerase-like protein (cupin superfamily)